MKRHTKLSSGEQQNLAEAQIQQTSAREFSSVEELLRHDAKEIVVPPAVGKRLAQSIQNLPRPATSWWRRFLRS
jgi:hypothetical protein